MKCMGDFGALSPEQRTRRERLKDREPAMIRPMKVKKPENVIYYSQDLNPQQGRKIKDIPVQTVYSERIPRGFSQPIIPRAELKKQKPKKKLKLTKSVKASNEVRIVRPVKPQVKAPTREFTVKAPTRELTVKVPTRELAVKAPTRELTVIPTKAQIRKQAQKIIAKKSNLKKKIKVKKSPKAGKVQGMSGNYCMGDFGDQMGFKIKMPKIKMPKLKMPEIRIGKRMQAEILKPIATVGKVVAPAAILIPGIGPAVAAGISAGAASVSALATQLATKAEYDIAVKKAKDQQKKIEKQMAEEMTAQQQAEIQAQTNQQIAQAAQEKKRGMATAGILGIGAAAAVGAFFLLKE
jgi:hypothetical protein